MCKKSMLGYHGTTRVNAELIVAEQHIKASTRTNDWLGSGAYFFAYKDHAIWWISHKRYTCVQTRILSADLEYTDNQMLDLDDPGQLRALDDIVKAAIELSEEAGEATSAVLYTQKEKWCFACNLIRRVNPEIGIIMYTFRDSGDRRIYKHSAFYGNQRQICVSNPSIVTNIKIV